MEATLFCSLSIDLGRVFNLYTFCGETGLQALSLSMGSEPAGYSVDSSCSFFAYSRPMPMPTSSADCNTVHEQLPLIGFRPKFISGAKSLNSHRYHKSIPLDNRK